MYANNTLDGLFKRAAFGGGGRRIKTGTGFGVRAFMKPAIEKGALCKFQNFTN